MRLAILSGKGGTGKTTVAISLAEALGKPIIGADVESPTTIIAYGDEIVKREPLYRRKPRVIEDSCIACGICAEACPFGAIMMLGKAYIDEEACEGCLYCIDKCPVGAIVKEKELIGELRFGRKVLVEGSLRPGRKDSWRVLEEVLKLVPEDAIIDGAPGASPLVYRIARKADAVLLVVEPNKPSIADASRVLELLARLGKPAGIVINKYGLGRPELVEELANTYGVPIVGRISFRRELLEKRVIEVPEVIEEAKAIRLEFFVPRSVLKPPHVVAEPKETKRLAKHISVVSGKGGTGKTLISIGLSRYLKVPVVDADVDAPDSYVLLGEPKREYSVNGRVYRINPETCTGCGECIKACYNGSIYRDGEKFRISEELCEGCGICKEACPVDAIQPKERPFGFIGHGKGFYIGQSDIGRAGIGDLVYKLKLIASNEFDKFVLDGSPGSGCTTIASISGSSAVIIVVEPKPESLSSARRVAEIAKVFGIKRYVIINKRLGKDVDVSDIGELLGYVPFDEEVFEAYAEGKRPEHSKAAEAIRKIAESLKFLL